MSIFDFLRNSDDGREILSIMRSPHWERVRGSFLKGNPQCAACGRRTNLNVHHIIPFHLDYSLELVTSNLITLCEYKTLNCHLWIGHLGNYQSFNKDVIGDSATLVQKINNRP